MAVGILKSARTESPRVVNAGRGTFGWESDLFLNGLVSDDIAVLSNVRVTDREYLWFDYLAVRFVDMTPLHLNIQAGKFDMPFGNLSERRFPRNNPLYSLPLMYEYGTALPSHFPTDQEILNGRGKGPGMPLLSGGLYDIGAMVYGSAGILTYAAAVSDGTVSTATYGVQNQNGDFGKILRVAVTPMAGLTVGTAYGWGAYLYDATYGAAASLSPSDYIEQTAEVDIAASRGHLVLYGEGVYGTWKVPLQAGDENLSVFGFYGEGKYTLIPRLYVAVRVNGLRFNQVSLGGATRTWDYDVTEWEGGVGYFVEHNVVFKLVRRETRTSGGTHPKDNLSVLQVALEF